MKNNLLIYVVVIAVVLLLIGNFVVNFGTFNTEQKENEQINPELEKYRSEDIPEDCRLPEYEDDVEWWKQHLGHHKETWYCLDYYEK